MDFSLKSMWHAKASAGALPSPVSPWTPGKLQRHSLACLSHHPDRSKR